MKIELTFVDIIKAQFLCFAHNFTWKHLRQNMVKITFGLYKKRFLYVVFILRAVSDF